MKPLHLLIAAIVILAIAGFAYNQSGGPAENAGAAVDEAVNDATRAVEDAAD